MDNRFFASREELHNVQMDVRQLQAVQTSQTERLLRLEKRQQDDAAMRSAWSNSPFPSALVGTPQHGPIRVPSTEAFDLDVQSQTLGSLHLEPDDEPIRRAAAASRANSVRFDESANLAQSARHLSEIGPFRPGSSLMMERSLSHKSDGRHSSAGHSVHSMASGRGSSLALETNFMTGGHDSDSPIDMPEPPPVFFVLGSVPALIRCWLTKDFANNTLLYAAVCSGAQKSTVDFSLVKELGLTDLIYRAVDNTYKIHLQMYLAEAIPSMKSADPMPQIPYLAVTFEVVRVEQTDDVLQANSQKSIRIFIGSDTLRMHSADVLFSRNLLSLYSSEREKLSVPFVRPEDDSMFKDLCTMSSPPERPKLNATAAEFISSELKSQDGIDMVGDDVEQQQQRMLLARGSQDLGDDEPQLALEAQDRNGGDQDELRQRQQQQELVHPEQELLQDQRPGLQPANGRATTPGAMSPTTSHPVPASRWPGTATTQSESGGEGEPRHARNSTSSEYSGKEPGSGSGSGSTFENSGRRDASAIWGSWRQGGSTTGSDGSHRENGSLSGYQPAGRPRAMKVLKSKTGGGLSSSRVGSSYEPAPPQRPSGDQRRRSQGPLNTSASGNENGTSSNGGGGSGGGTGGGSGTTGSNVIRWESKRSISSNNTATNSSAGQGGKDSKGQQQGLAALELRSNQSSAPRSSNPVGGASAFAWMKPSKPKTPTTTGGE